MDRIKIYEETALRSSLNGRVGMEGFILPIDLVLHEEKCVNISVSYTSSYKYRFDDDDCCL